MSASYFTGDPLTAEGHEVTRSKQPLMSYSPFGCEKNNGMNRGRHLTVLKCTKERASKCFLVNSPDDLSDVLDTERIEKLLNFFNNRWGRNCRKSWKRGQEKEGKKRTLVIKIGKPVKSGRIKSLKEKFYSLSLNKGM
ncbi:hypothetical protein NPIL_297801 [Nephila pilipes]|uniref:Uncharacterized protein n=1 Tax=Nephila pilipes TaxID=299642 RepID=A0A8X6TVU8_NEPPI|nr:hypothetical protein NPIL_297801 [Nephila pilipes]